MIYQSPSSLRQEFFLVISLLFAAGLAHGLNMFHYPYYEADEGTYMSQAWSLATQFKLAPYTYTYDHAPAGWILIALWSYLTGFFTFGSAINSGRVLILILHLASVLFLYLITRRLTDSPLSSLVAALFFSLSPWGIYFQRRVLLDNIMVFWVLFSLALLIYHPQRRLIQLVSAIFMGIAVVTKENAIFFIPGFVYLLLVLNPSRRPVTLLIWIAGLLLPVLFYLAYALSRGELFPYGSSLGGPYPHVSLIETWAGQLNRGGTGILDPNSSFWLAFNSWIQSDPLLIIISLLSFIICLYFSVQHHSFRLSVIFTSFFILFLIRGGLVLEFYLLPLIPFLGLNFGLVFSLLNRLKFLAPPYFLIPTFLLLALLIGNLLYYGNRSRKHYNLFISDQSTPQVNAIDWILSQSQPEVFYVIDNYAYVDLHGRRQNQFKHAEYYWKVDKDPMIAQDILNNDWRYISYLSLTPQMEGDITQSENGLTLTASAYDNSQLIKEFYQDGWGVKILKVLR